MISFKNYKIFLIVFVFTASLFVPQTYAQNKFEKIRNQLRRRIETSQKIPKIVIRKEIVYSSKELFNLYKERNFYPIWSDVTGLRPIVNQFLSELNNAEYEGLDPLDYHFKTIEYLINRINGNNKSWLATRTPLIVDLDFLLTDAFLVYASHLLNGRTNPESINAEWFVESKKGNVQQIVDEALNSGYIKVALQKLLPQQNEYNELKDALTFYKSISLKGGFPYVPEGPKLNPGETSSRVIRLRERLAVINYVENKLTRNSDYYDKNLESAVKRFQQNNGLLADGIVGLKTITELNVPVQERINQIIINLERWRWLPRDLGDRYILVNIAGFELHLVENHDVKLSMKIIVGTDFRKTPVFTGNMTYIVINPSWNVPTTIAVKDKLPIIKKDPEYLYRHNIKVYSGWGRNMQLVDPDTVNWANLDTSNFHYHFKQDPGPGNSLGRIKFMFPNKFNVYLHDTPTKNLFRRDIRTFSSGCVRIEKPLELAEYLLSKNYDWSRPKILRTIREGTETKVDLTEPIKVHILYWTAWVDEKGELNFRTDIYERDKKLEDSLFKSPPSTN